MSAFPSEQRVIVRLSKSYWLDRRGIHSRIDLNFLKRKSKGDNFVYEDATCAGADIAFQQFINLDEYQDGIYEIVICNEKRDWETGYIDGRDYKLISYEDDKP